MVVKEAVAIRRQLADLMPDSFLPKLASSLHNLTLRLEENELREEALLAIEEAITILLPFFFKSPDVYQVLMCRIVKSYIRCCNNTAIAPSEKLLKSILNKLNKPEDKNDS